MEKTYPTLQEVLGKVVGTPLSSVVFVEDYIQLEWRDSFLSAYTMPSIAASGETFREDNPEYRSMMYRLEGRALEKVEVIHNEAVNLNFTGGTLLSISLRDDDYVAPEALIYQERNGLCWVA